MIIKAIALILTLTLAFAVPRASAPALDPLTVIDVSPPDGATNVARNTRITATFDCDLYPPSVNPSTFRVSASGLPVLGVPFAFGRVAMFTPLGSLPARALVEIRIVGGPAGVQGTPLCFIPQLPADFVSTFWTGPGTLVLAATGGTVTDLRTGAATAIPAYTLKNDIFVKVVTLDSPSQTTEVDPKCDGLSISTNESLPTVPDFVRVTEAVRYEGDPCGQAFGPGMVLTLPLLPPYRNLKTGTALRLFQLGRSATGELVFRDTGIVAKVGQNSTATVPDIQVFGTFAAFMPGPTPAEGAGPLFFAAIDQMSGRITRVSIANPDPSNDLSVNLAAYDAAGNQQGSQTRGIPRGSQASFFVADLFPGVQQGAIVAQAVSGSLTGFCEIANNFASPTMWASAEAITTPQSALLFPVVDATSQTFTEVHIFNPNSETLNVDLQAFGAAQNPVYLVDPDGTRVTTLQVPALGKIVAASSGAPASSPNVIIPDSANGGYFLVQSVDGVQKFVGTEVVGESRGGKQTVGMLNGLPFALGCSLTTSGDPACHVDASVQATVPGAARQHTLYAPYIEGSSTGTDLIVVNTSDSTAQVAFSAFREDGSFSAAYPTSGFTSVLPHQILRMSVQALFPSVSTPTYVRIEDPNSALVGVVINRDPVNNTYKTAMPLVTDIPQLVHMNSDSFFSRIQVDSSSANPRITTGLIVFNPNNNSIPFTLTVKDSSGTVWTAGATLVARGVYTRTRNSLSVVFPSCRTGYAEVLAKSALAPGTGGRLIVVGVYRSKSGTQTQALSAVREQNKWP